MLVERGRNTDGNKIHIFDKAEIGGSREHSALYDFGKVAVHYVADVVVTGVDHLHLLRLHVKADGLKAGFGFFHRQRQSDIAQSDYADHDLFIFYFAKHLSFHHVRSLLSVNCIYFLNEDSL